MSIKPFSEVVSEEVQSQNNLKPFVDSAVGGVEIEDNVVFQEREKVSFVSKSIGFMTSLQGLFLILLLFMSVALLVDAVTTLQELLSSGSLLDLFYLFALILLLASFLGISYKNIKQIRMLKSARRHQEAFSQQKGAPDSAIVPMTLELLNYYEQQADPAFEQRAGVLKERISSSHDYEAIYKELDEEVVEVIDVKVQERIKVAAAQAALSTAISPLALLDAMIVVWRGVRLTKEIALLYGYKPGWVSTIVLLKQGAMTVFFVGATELAVEYMHAASESTIVSKLSLSAGEGVSNGILLARIGYGVMAACRPLPIHVKRGSFMKAIVTVITESMTKKDSNG